MSAISPLGIPDLRQALDEVRALRLQVATLARRQDTTERELARGMTGDLDRVLNLKETAAAIGKRPSTLRHWLADAVLFERHHLNAFMRKDVTGHWVSSPRLVARYRQVAFRALQELAR